MAVVFDCGTFTTKIGFSFNKSPLAVEPSVVSFYDETDDETDPQPRMSEDSNRWSQPNSKQHRLVKPGSINHRAHSRWLVGKAATRQREYAIQPFMRDGSVHDWVGYEAFMEGAYSEILRCDPRENPLMLSVPAMSAPGYKSRLAESAFETFDVPSLGLGLQPVLALYAHWSQPVVPTEPNTKQSVIGIVVDAGESAVSVVPVVDGYVVGHGVRRVNSAGAAATGIYAEALVARGELKGLQVTSRDVLEIARKAKEHYGFVSQDPLKELIGFDETAHKKELSVQLAAEDADLSMESSTDKPGNQQKNSCCLEVGCERFLASEVFFDPSFTGVVQSVPSAIAEAISSSPLDYRRQLYENVLLCGGSAGLPGFAKRLRAELKKLTKTNVAVTQNVEISKFAVWAGAAALCEQMDSQPNGWFTKKQYWEEGPHRIEIQD